MRQVRLIAILHVIGTILLSGGASAQNTNATPLYGSTHLESGFRPDPFVVEVQAGGPDSSSELGAECAGFISNEKPDYDLSYTAGEYPLGVFVTGDTDTTLVINDPAGNWYCNDDHSEAGGRNPGIVFGQPPSGLYNIWVGTYGSGAPIVAVNLVVTEGLPPWGASEEPSAPGTTLAGSGTGFFVSESGHILTNNHVIEGCTRTTIQVRGQTATEAVVLASNVDADLALLRIDGRPPAVAPFRAARDVRLGEEIVVYGFPLPGDLSSQGNLTIGIVSALSGLGDDLGRMQISAQIQPGNSGGPVMDRQGNVVGVIVSSANDQYFLEQLGTVPQNVNFAIRDALARSFLDTNNVPYVVAENSETVSIVNIAERAQDFTGTILCYR